MGRREGRGGRNRQRAAARPTKVVVAEESGAVAVPRSAPVEELRPGWGRPRPEHIPRPTYWPAVLALGVTFALWGLITTWVLSIVGVGLLAIGIGGWIGEWRHEH